ncbi:MAG: TRAP transporter small permease [Sneathiellaceae bacterium]
MTRRHGLYAVDRALVLLGSASGVATLLMILIVVPDVLARKFLAETIPAASEVNIHLLVLLIFLGLAGAQAQQAHFTMTALVDRLPAPPRRLLGIATGLASFAFAGFMTWMTAGKAWGAFLRDEVTIGTIALSVWPFRMIVALGFGLLALQLFLQVLRLCLALPVAATGPAADAADSGCA